MKHVFFVALILILSIFAVKPILSSGFFPMHDDTQVGRVVAMGRALKEGQFPVRWVADLGFGYGYPIFNFYAPLPYYVGGAFYAVGMSGLTATKIMFIAGLVLPALTVFATTVGAIGAWGALTASIFLLFSPYHAVQVYVRGAVGEYWTLVFIPLLLWALLQADGKKRLKTVVVGSLGLAGTILSHTLLGYAATLFLALTLICYWIFTALRKRWNRTLFVDHMRIVVFGLGLSAFFWLPAIFEMRFTNVAAQISATADYRDHFACLRQLWDSPWGFGGSQKGCIDGLSFKVGKLHILAAVLAIAMALVHRKKRRHPLVFAAAGITLVSAFLALPASQFLWNILPQFAYLQYPWRFLAGAELGLSLLAGALVMFLGSKTVKMVTSAVLIALVMLTNVKLFTPQYLYAKEPSEFETRAELRWRVSRISDEYLPPAVPRPTDASQVVSATILQSGSVDSQIEVDTATYARLRVRSTKSADVTIGRAYFPGWRYSINGARVMPDVIGGLPKLRVPAGASTIELQFDNTAPRTLGNLMSSAAVVLLLIMYGYRKKTVA